jgi:hypothetical protein
LLLLLAVIAFSVLKVEPRDVRAEPGSVVINTQAEWERFAESPPRVDFEKHTVVAIFAGEKPTGGYSIRLVGGDKRGEGCEIRYRVQEPPPGAIVTQAITSVFAVVRLDTKCSTVDAKKL